MLVFFGLPDELSQEIVSGWLDSNSLGKLDSAVCSRQWRSQLLDFLTFAKGCISHCCGIKKLQWMNGRGISVHELTYSEEETGSDWQHALAPVWKNLKKLTLANLKYGSNYATQLNFCSNLDVLIIQDRFWDICELSGEIFKNLTHLEWPTSYSPSGCDVAILTLAHKHCRKLKTFRFEYNRSYFGSDRLLEGILKENPGLESVSCNVSFLKDLTRYSRSLTSIGLCGDMNYTTMVRVLNRFDKIDHIHLGHGTQSSTKPSATYIRSKNSLCLKDASTMLEGWKRFRRLITELRELILSGGDNQYIASEDKVLSKIQSLTVSYSRTDKEQLKTLLMKCTALTKFCCVSYEAINWPAVLSESNRIESLTVSGPNLNLQYLLTACRYLTEVSFTNCAISQEMAQSLVHAIRCYRHATTGQPLRCSCEFYIEDRNTIHQLNYDGSRFSGSLWDEYGRLIEAYTTEKDESITRLTDRVRELEDEVEALKKYVSSLSEVRSSSVST